MRDQVKRSLPSFDAVVDRHGLSVLRFCIARTDRTRGEDCFQETMLAALRHYEEVRDIDAIGTWLLSIAHRKTIDAVRASARAPVPVDDVEDRAAAEIGPPLLGEAWGRVRKLPPKQREAIALRYLTELSHREIATVMETSEAAARRNVFEGLKQLRTALTDLTNGPDGPSDRHADD